MQWLRACAQKTRRTLRQPRSRRTEDDVTYRLEDGRITSSFGQTSRHVARGDQRRPSAVRLRRDAV